MENLLFTVNAVLPIILLIVLGYILKRLNFFQDSFLKIANKLCFRVCLPALLFCNIYKIDNFNDFNWTFILFIMLSILILFFIGLIIVKLFIPDNKQKGVVLQASFRSNYAIIGVSLAISLAGADSPATAIASLVAAFSIPLFNILAVLSLSMFDRQEGKRIEIKKILINIVKNPLIIGVVLGLIAVGIRLFLKNLEIQFTIKENLTFLYKAIDSVGSIATPLALIVLGGQFAFQSVKSLRKQIIISTTLRIIITPTIFLIIAYFYGFRNMEFPALIALFGTPIAVSSVPMAAEMGQDDQLAGQLVVWTTLLSAFSLFIIIIICKSCGLL